MSLCGGLYRKKIETLVFFFLHFISVNQCKGKDNLDSLVIVNFNR